MRHALTAALVGILLLAAGAALADDAVQLASGTRVRVTVRTGGGRLVGTVLALNDKNLTLLGGVIPKRKLCCHFSMATGEKFFINFRSVK